MMTMQRRRPVAGAAPAPAPVALKLVTGLLALLTISTLATAFLPPTTTPSPTAAARPWTRMPPSSAPARRSRTAPRPLYAIPPLVGPQEAEAAASALQHMQSQLLLAMDGVVNGGEEDTLESAGSAILNWLTNLNYGNVFAASLFPYLAFLRNIWPKDYPIPKTMKYGFASLLIFVVSTIIGGIVAKIQYNDVLANIDYLHGTAESLLGVTNIVLALGAYQALQAAKKDGPREERRWSD